MGESKYRGVGISWGRPGEPSRRRRARAPLERSARRGPRLVEVWRQEERLAAIGSGAPVLSAAEKDRLLALGDDLEAAWAHSGATAETRKRILRTVLEEIVCTLSEHRIELLLHWRGGDHTRLTVARNRTGQHRWSSDAEVRDLIRAPARQQGPGSRTTGPSPPP